MVKPVAAPPYRFRLDEREIDAERPKAIIGISFEFAMIAVFHALHGKWINGRKIESAHEKAAYKTGFPLCGLAR